MKGKNALVLFLAAVLYLQAGMAQSRPAALKPRIIITADPELDDLNSLIRFLLYSTDFTVEGLVYASSQFHWAGDGKGTKFMVPGREYDRYGLHLCPCESYRWKKGERFIHEAVEAYEKVYHNLVIHNSAYPSPSYLKSKIRYGNIEFEGDISKDSEGSDLIKAVLLDNKPGPVYVTAWGGQSTIARALKSIEEEFAITPQWQKIRKKVTNKLVILPSGEQDNTYASYIKPNWPGIDYRMFSKGPNYGYGAQLVATPTNAPYLTAEWMKANISSKGPLGSLYRVWGDGKHMVEGDRFDYFGKEGYTNEQMKEMGYVVWMPVQPKGSWLGEGDTFTFMNLLDNGLQASKKDHPGGWSGRLIVAQANAYNPFSNDTAKVKDLVITDSLLRSSSRQGAEEPPYPDFFPAAHLDFAARMNWSVTNEFTKANHPPVIAPDGASQFKVKPGSRLRIAAKASDPDGNPMSVQWWNFPTTPAAPAITIVHPSSLQTEIQIPLSAVKGSSLFLVLEVRDQGSLPLTRYRLYRIVIT
jgi:Protein of unknown function (DUF1593)